MSVLVLHGHKGNSKDSRTCQTIQKYLGQYDIIPVDYPSESSREEIIKHLDALPIDWKEVEAVIGTSLGGYWARYLGRKLMADVIMINPSLRFYNDDDTDPLDLYIHLIINEDDNVLDPQYAINKYKGRAHIITLKTGGHRCENLASCIDEIEKMLNSVCE
ncbi:MAG: hypothetical protein PHC51_04125 [bacterium]|nr:hypothetical protein [bacterium]